MMKFLLFFASLVTASILESYYGSDYDAASSAIVSAVSLTHFSKSTGATGYE